MMGETFPDAVVLQPTAPAWECPFHPGTWVLKGACISCREGRPATAVPAPGAGGATPAALAAKLERGATAALKAVDDAEDQGARYLASYHRGQHDACTGFAMDVRQLAPAWDALAAERDRLAGEVAHLSAALAGDNEGVRLWMLDCGNLTDKHRQEAAGLRQELATMRAELESVGRGGIAIIADRDRYRTALEAIRDNRRPLNAMGLQVIARAALEGAGTGDGGDGSHGG